MAHQSVQEAVRRRLAENFAAARIFAEGEIAAPNSSTAYVVIQFPYNEAEQASIGAPGSNWYRETGGVRFVINARRNVTGIADGRRWADEIAKLFRGAYFDGVRTFAPTSPVTDDSNDAAGGYYVLTFVVEYQSTITG